MKVGDSPPPKVEELGRTTETTYKKGRFLAVTQISYTDGSKKIEKAFLPAGTSPSALEIPTAAAIPMKEEEYGDIEVVFTSHGLVVSPPPPPAAGPPPPTTIPRAPATFLGRGTTRRSHICCGVCCDCRRAVMGIDLMCIILSIIAISVAAHVERNPDDYTDENGDSNLEWYTDVGISFGALLACYLVGISFLVIAIHGAVNFQGCSVWFGLIYHWIDAVVSIVMLNPVGIIVSLLFAYPHAILINEIKMSVMSEERYPIESYSCCCFPPQIPQEHV